MESGEPRAAEQLLAQVYNELRRLAAAKMARERPGHTLQPTALVHEAWLRLGGDAQPAWQTRRHFFGAAAEAMRRVLIGNARRKHAARRGVDAQHVDIDSPEIEVAAPVEDVELLRVHDALDRLAEEDPRKAELVKLRYFVGMSIEEAAEALGISDRTAKRDWTYARAWLGEAIERMREKSRSFPRANPETAVGDGESNATPKVFSDVGAQSCCALTNFRSDEGHSKSERVGGALPISTSVSEYPTDSF